MLVRCSTVPCLSFDARLTSCGVWQEGALFVERTICHAKGYNEEDKSAHGVTYTTRVQVDLVRPENETNSLLTVVGFTLDGFSFSVAEAFI